MIASQLYQLGSQRLFGTRLTAAQVAEVAWKAAYGTRVHWSPTFTGTMIDALRRLVPPLHRPGRGDETFSVSVRHIEMETLSSQKRFTMFTIFEY
jgi:hypothetical protein